MHYNNLFDDVNDNCRIILPVKAITNEFDNVERIVTKYEEQDYRKLFE